jgi:hypothetical protein
VELSAGFLYLNIKNFQVKKLIVPSLILLFVACNPGRTFKKAEDAQDAGREFIRASLDGDEEKAEFYLWQDSTNRVLMNKWERDYRKLDQEIKRKYKEADILVINFKTQNDSVSTYTFSNSYKKDTTTIKIVRLNGEWLVDLKEILNTKESLRPDEMLNPQDSLNLKKK